MTPFPLRICYVLIVCLPLMFASDVKSKTNECVTDIRYLPGFLLANDTGAQTHLEQHGEKYFDEALSKAISEAEQVAAPEDCGPIMKRYMRAWRKGHLFAVPTDQLESKVKQQAKHNPEKAVQKITNPIVRDPQIEFLSDKTALITLASFIPQYEKPLKALLKQHHDQLASVPNWIIDVRLNQGGSDATYAPLLPWILDGETSSVGTEWLVTPENIKAQQTVCQKYAPGIQSCLDHMNRVYSAMATATLGEYVEDQTEAITYDRQKILEPKRPQRIGVMIDRSCGSSCEEFLLIVRQSFQVKLLGRRTYGSLDYSNLRSHTLPSGNYELYYATSRSLRLPDSPVDIAGVIPDVYLEKIDDPNAQRQEVMRVKNWLEGGSLADTSE